MDISVKDGKSGDSEVASGVSSVLTVTTKAIARVVVITIASQTHTDSVIDPAVLAIETDAADEHALECVFAVRTCDGVVELARLIAAADEDFIVFSTRADMIWDRSLFRRVRREVIAFDDLGLQWFSLCADGMNVDGERYCAAFFEQEPSLLPTRGRRLIVETAGTLIAVNNSSLRSLFSRNVAEANVVALINKTIIFGLSQGIGSFFTSGFYPCLTQRKNAAFVDPKQHLLSMDFSSLLSVARTPYRFPAEVLDHCLLRSWVEMLSVSLSVKHSFSFVVRTIFTRPHLLRRCLISIDYLRRSLNISVQVVIASDVEEKRAEAAIDELSSEFPGIEFALADGTNEAGYSRVRNLVSGIKESTGDRVCIIDDDDYYTPQAISSFLQACEFDSERLVIFDTQVVVEKWALSGVKPHKKIVEYGLLFEAKSWAVTLRGSNSIPLCGIIYPGSFIRSAILDYEYHFDLSEDFALHLCIFAHPKRPEIKTIDAIGAYQSHRKGEDNVSVVTDRTEWALDTGNGLFDLLITQGRTFEVFHSRAAIEGQDEINSRIMSLELELERVRQAHHSATRTLAKLVSRLARQIQ